MRFILGALFDPLGEKILLLFVERFMALGCGHDLVRVGREDALNEFTFFRFSGDDCTGIKSVVADVETKVAFPRVWISPVAEETLVRENGSDIPSVLDLAGIET